LNPSARMRSWCTREKFHEQVWLSNPPTTPNSESNRLTLNLIYFVP
jgi:hypothetical protein